MDVNIWLFEELARFSHERYLHLLPEARREKALAYRNVIDQKLCVAAFLLLRMALRENGFHGEPVIEALPNGKPFLVHPTGLHFNLSHCDKGAACALAEHAIGVDIQDVRPASERLIKKTMCEEEIAYIQASESPDRAFARLWSRKESILKQSGEGIRCPLAAVNTLAAAQTDTYEGEDFFLSLSGGEIALARVSAGDFLRLLE
ncbi:MAG: 4'-phosphopantetheinyl transferase superfamily protein [Oscillospiraceae bacterium]|jgi:4'-phosphopantetheinyl transferase|nr:4'-phosphopantetheinyl transferase superfamily protein [Oscillospiraceae bacterium]